MTVRPRAVMTTVAGSGVTTGATAVGTVGATTAVTTGATGVALRDDRGGYGRRDDRDRDRDREPVKRLPIDEDVTGNEIDERSGRS